MPSLSPNDGFRLRGGHESLRGDGLALSSHAWCSPRQTATRALLIYYYCTCYSTRLLLDLAETWC